MPIPPTTSLALDMVEHGLRGDEYGRSVGAGYQKLLHIKLSEGKRSPCRYFPLTRMVQYLVAICPCTDELTTEANPIQQHSASKAVHSGRSSGIRTYAAMARNKAGVARTILDP